MTVPELPINAVLPELLCALEAHDEAVLEAPPGAGKTTGTPLPLLEAKWLGKQTILLVEPRRLAAKAAAQRLAYQLGETVGKTVGYRVRLEQKVSAATRIEVITEGILTRRLQSDPALEGVGLVIFDEFHERNLEADLALALILDGRDVLRDEAPLKLLVMSATLDGKAIAELLGGAPRIRSEGRSYPITEYYRPVELGVPIAEPVVRVIIEALTDQRGSLLVFLPGQREIQETARLLEAKLILSDVVIAPLYGDLPLPEQQRAIDPAPAGLRKIVLATAIAETSLTIEGISVVVDSGLSRSARFDPNLGINRLETRRLSKAAAKQRAGRAGRLGPGFCYRLWSDTEQAGLAAFADPEILQADLAPLALQLITWGVDDPAALSWLTPPPEANYEQACQLLESLQALQPQSHGGYRLTAHGQQMAELPMHPRLAHLMISGAQLGHPQLAAEMAAILSDRDPLNGQTQSADIEERIDALHQPLKSLPGAVRGRFSRAHQLSQRFNREIKNQNIPLSPERPSASEALALLLALAYPERIAARRQSGGNGYQLANGRGAELDAGDALQQHRFLACAQLSSVRNRRSDRIQLAAALPADIITQYLGSLVTTGQQVEWDKNENRLKAENQQRLGALILESRPAEIDPAQKIPVICEQIRRHGIQWLQFNADTQALRARVNFIRTHDNTWPDFSDAALEEHVEEWLGPYLHPVTTLGQLRQLDFLQILKAALPWPMPQQLDQLAPERYRVPSGSSIRIDYSSQPPVLAVKLQEMFGATQTPTIGFGVALKLQLLSPAQRPLQVTQDLIGFWNNGYNEVKKEMKGRYPKHPWPDDPLTAPATARTKARMNKP